MSIKRREFCLFGPLQILLQHAAHREGRPGTEKQQDHRHRIRCQKNPRQQCGCNAQRTRQGTLRKTKRKQPRPAPGRAFPLPLKRKEVDCRAAQDQPQCARPAHQGILPGAFRQKKNRRGRSRAQSGAAAPQNQPRPKAGPERSAEGAPIIPPEQNRLIPAPGLWSAPASKRTEKVG